MEATKKNPSRKSGGQTLNEKIRIAYKTYLLTHGKQPPSVFKFCVDLGITEDEFYRNFPSLEGVDRSLWKGFIDQTTNRLQADETFAAFTSREKILAFYFTLLEELKTDRSLVLFFLNGVRRLELTPGYLKSFKPAFETFFVAILAEGKERGEVAIRPYLDKQYPKLFWMHLGFILVFWKEDDSKGFEKTDAAVEKSVNLAFDLIGNGALDTAIDFGKFLYQNR
jgi:AcrR family transcriptional regulator